jgi:hypothetical protein
MENMRFTGWISVIIIIITIITIIIYLSCIVATCGPVPVSRVKQSLQM